MKKLTGILTLACVILLMVIAGSVQADVLLSDNFNTGSDDSIDSFNTPSAPRQGGTLVGTDWHSKRRVQQIESNEVVMYPHAISGAARLYPGHDFTDTAITNAGGFVVSYDFMPGSDHVSWIAFNIGLTSTQVNNEEDSHLLKTYTDFSLMLRGNGGYVARDSAVTQGDGTCTALATNSVVITVATSSFASGQNATISATYNGSAMDLNGAASGNDLTIAWDSGAANYIEFETNSDLGHSIDNFEIGTIPEPATMVLLGLGGIGMLVRRRRRA